MIFIARNIAATSRPRGKLQSVVEAILLCTYISSHSLEVKLLEGDQIHILLLAS